MAETKAWQNAEPQSSGLEGVILNPEGRFVGETAKVDPQKETLEILTEQYRRSPVSPEQSGTVGESRGNREIFDGGIATCCLVVEYANNPNKHYGTAFFVTHGDLLTAGHNLVSGPDRATRVSITPPGLPQIDPTRLNTIRCEIVFNHYRADDPDNSIEVAALKAEAFHAASPLTFLERGVVLPTEEIVSVIGYPGDVARPHLLRAEHILHADLEAVVAITEHALPAKTLVETRGRVQQIDNASGTIHYEISTLQGMSGSAVLYNGKICGNYFPDLLMVGVHHGFNKAGWGKSNYAAFVACPRIREAIDNGLATRKSEIESSRSTGAAAWLLNKLQGRK